ncbi:MAG: transporter substrate-binding domain-containing protein [Proteobacteria bacterium]|nr:transporter substrate-binding domain-containing protein [Pseudomonadota bacterium]MBI3498098.1 transporter substrate-binding domain-containing protein [Pseudomonadota bacterium]
MRPTGKVLGVLILALLALPGAARGADGSLAPTGTLRAAYLAGNPAQATRNPATGEVVGVAADLTAELARRLGVPFLMTGLVGVPQVMQAVVDGKADIGYLATDPSRRGAIEFTQTYLRNPQSLVVPEASPIRSFADIDRAGLRIAALKGDSIALYLARTLKSAALVELERDATEDIGRLFASGSIDAFGRNRLRLVRIVAETPGLRVLPGSIFGVPQAIIVPADQPQNLAALNAFLTDMRRSGFLEASISHADNGTEMEPAP